MFFATKINANGTKQAFFQESETLEGMRKVIAEWKSQVTASMAQAIKFDVRHDDDIETTIEVM